MTSLIVDVELPRDVLTAMDVSEPALPQRVRQLLATELFREGRISSGKAADLASMTKVAFVQVLSEHGIPYFTETAEELDSQVRAVGRVVGAECLSRT
jgi:predicted HTH domain antitoxin